jgi:WD40 repeat protein
MDGRELATLDGEQQYTASFTQGNILPEATFSPDGTLVATQCFTNLVNVWDVASGRQLARFKGHTGNLTALAFSPAGARLLTGSTDGTLRIWDLGRETETAEQVAQFVAEKGKWRLDADGNPVEFRPAKPPAR